MQCTGTWVQGLLQKTGGGRWMARVHGHETLVYREKHLHLCTLRDQNPEQKQPRLGSRTKTCNWLLRGRWWVILNFVRSHYLFWWLNKSWSLGFHTWLFFLSFLTLNFLCYLFHLRPQLSFGTVCGKMCQVKLFSYFFPLLLKGFYHVQVCSCDSSAPLTFLTNTRKTPLLYLAGGR